MKPQVAIDNLYSPFYFGDPNVTEGKQFWISCRAEPPIKWYKDGEAIEKNFLRYGKDEFTYTAKDLEGQNGKTESTLSVTRASLRHKGKYQCNINHENSHYLNVHPARQPRESEEISQASDVDDDHEDMRTSFEPSVTPVPVLPLLPTYESNLEYDDEKSREKFEDRSKDQEVTESYSVAVQNSPESIQNVLDIFDESIPGQKVKEIIESNSQPVENVLEVQETKMARKNFEPLSSTLATIDDLLPEFDDDDSTLQLLSTNPSTTPASFTNIPLHPTHAIHTKHAVHSTHVMPSESASTQSHPVQRHKGSQPNLKWKMIRKSSYFRYYLS